MTSLQAFWSLKTIRSIGRNLLDVVFNYPKNPHLVGRDHHHVEKPHRRRFTAPHLVIEQISKALIQDPHFLEAIDVKHRIGLVRVALVGDYIHANLYHLRGNFHQLSASRHGSPTLRLMFDHDWQGKSIAHFLLTVDSENSQIQLSPITRKDDGELSFEYLDPYASYFRPMTLGEIESFSTTTRPCWRQ